MSEEERSDCGSEDDVPLNEKSMEKALREEERRRLLKDAEKAKRRGVCYLSRIPPHMNPSKLRQIMCKYGQIGRVYLTPEDPTAQVRRKMSGGFRGQEFSEGWVEFADKKVARRSAKMLNGEQIAMKNAMREQKLTMELSAATRERDFYLSKVDKSKALSKIEEQLKKKQKIEMLPKVIREFPQNQTVMCKTGENEAQLPADILAGVFGGGST